MHTPRPFKQEDKQSLINAIKDIKFGALIIFSEGHFFSSHLPFIVKETQTGTSLETHVSKANELWKVTQKHHKALVIFQGPHAYIHPGWYPTKTKTGKVVPTWNYQAIHCHGYSESQPSEDWLVNHLTELTNHNEQDQENPWQLSDAPDDFIHTLSHGIVGITVHVERIEGSLKMNQNHTEENRLGVIEGLSQSKNPNACAVSSIMRDLEAKRQI